MAAFENILSKISYTGFSRRVLEGDVSTLAEDIPLIVDERVINLGGEPARIGVNPITIDPDNSHAQLQQRIWQLGTTPTSIT